MTDRDQWHEHIDSRFDEIEKRLQHIDNKKQDKINKGAVIGLGATIIGQLILIAFMWGSQSQELKTATSDRYRGQDAARDFALRDQRDANLSTDILENSVRIEELRQRIRALEANLNNNE